MSGFSDLTTVVLGKDIVSIGNSAFRQTNFTSINLPENLITIGDYVFQDCEFSTITLPNKTKHIGYGAFMDCLKLRTIKLGSSIEYIDEKAFEGCKALYSFEISTEVPPIIEASTFMEVSHTMQIKVPCVALGAYKASTYWNEFSNYDVNTYKVSVGVNDEAKGNAHVVRQASCDDVTSIVQAQPQPGYKFVRWSDGFVENPHVVYVKRDTMLIAEFAEIDSDVNNVCIVESANEEIGGVDVILLASAIDGFKFSHWSDNNKENPRIISLEKSVELYAYFVMSDQFVDVDVSKIQSVNVYSNNGNLYVEGIESDYYILDMSGRLIYSGRDAELRLPRGVYVVNVGGEVQKVVI